MKGNMKHLFLIFLLIHQLSVSQQLPSNWISGPDVHLATLIKRLEQETDPVKKIIIENEINNLLRQRQQLESIFNQLEPKIRSLTKITEDGKVNYNCYRKLINTFKEQCYFVSSSPYFGGKAVIFYKTCKNLIDDVIIEKVNESISQTCQFENKSQEN